MKTKRLIKAICALMVAFVIVLLSLVFLDPNISIKRFFFKDKKGVESSYEITSKPKVEKPVSSNKTDSSESKPNKDDDEYANQILGGGLYYGNGDICNSCGGTGKQRCPTCYGTGQSSSKSYCSVCYGNGYIECTYCR